MSDPNAERERLADEAMGRNPDTATHGGPWAKTSSGDAEATTTDATGGIAGGDPELDGDKDGDADEN